MPKAMKTFIVIAWILYLGIGHAQTKIPPKSFMKGKDLHTLVHYFEHGFELLSTKTNFNTLVKNTKTTHVTTNATAIEILVQITSDIEILTFSDGTTHDMKFVELDFSTTNGTMITGITTVVTTTSTSSVTTLELDIGTGDIDGFSENVISKTTAAPVTQLKILVLLESSDIYFIDYGTVNTANVTSVEALADSDSTIKEIITNSRTEKGTNSMKIVLSSTCCESASTASTSTTSNSEPPTPNVTNTWNTVVVSSSPSPSAVYCDSEYSCVDCTTARVCAPTPGAPGLQEVTQFSCPDYAPWCDSHSGTCSRVRTPECDLPVVGNFTCMRNGHFPDPNSCTHYYLCENDVPLQFACVYPSPYYSAMSGSCSNSSSDCVDYQSLCEDKSGLKVNMPSVDYLFLYCVHGAVEVVDRCIGAYRFHFEQQRCVPECPYAGLFPRDDDCAGYYRCSPTTEGDPLWVMTNLTCPQGMGFSESDYDCIDRSLVSNCNASYIN